MFHSVDEVIAGLGTQKYICNKHVATVVYLGTALQKPILVEAKPSWERSWPARWIWI
jgi:hypothetical protein